MPELKWTHLSVAEITRELIKRGIQVSWDVVKRLLHELGFKVRRHVKSKTKAPSRHRDAQFRKIKKAASDYENTDDPVLSIDSKRKELLGDVQRSGDVIANQAAEVLDHDLPSYADGEVVPHGIYDVQENTGHITVSTGSDTGEFAVASLRSYWREAGSPMYPAAERMLILCDCGGSNSYRSSTFKQHLQTLASELNLPIQVAHYPVHCSKYNPIERKQFSHVERSFSGRTFEDAADVAKAAADTTTQQGLSISASELPAYKPARRRRNPPDLPNINHAADLPEYNYTFTPQKRS